MISDLLRVFGSWAVMAAMVLIAPLSAFSHGTEGSLAESRGWMVQAFYDDGEAMSYTETDVYLEPQTLPFQKGRTDRNGRFLFYPDAPGVWRIEVKDEMGHAVILKKEITDGMLAESRPDLKIGTPVQPERRGKMSGALAGVGLISFVTGFLFWMKSRKKNVETTHRPV